MEITKQEGIEILNTMKTIESLNQLDQLGYVFLRNTILLETVENEHNKIQEFIKKDFVEKFVDKDQLENADYSKKIESDYIQHLYSNENLKNFYEEKINIDFITFDLEKIKDEKFKFSLIKKLLGKIII